MKILVYGAGIIGCELAHELCKGKNEVTILARGGWKENIDKNGLRIFHYGQLHTTVDYIKTIDNLHPDDKFDLIFVVMQYNQVLEIIPQLVKNISSRIILIGNNMSPFYCYTQIVNQSFTEKELAFGFQGTGGRREKDKIISMHFKVSMTIGGLTENVSAEFYNSIMMAFEKTGYHLTFEQNMEGWLLSHVAHILPSAYLCYILDFNLKLANQEQINLAIDAIIEAHKVLKKLGYPIRPDGEEETYTKNRKKKQMTFYWLLKTPAGKFVISNHCANAVGEMMALDQKFQELNEKACIPMPAWSKLRKEAMIVLKRNGKQ